MHSQEDLIDAPEACVKRHKVLPMGHICGIRFLRVNGKVIREKKNVKRTYL